MNSLFVGSDVIVEIYRFALQLLTYVLGSAAMIAFVGCLFSMAQVFRNGESGPGLLRTKGNPDTGLSTAYPHPEPQRRLRVVRTRV